MLAHSEHSGHSGHTMREHRTRPTASSLRRSLPPQTSRSKATSSTFASKRSWRRSAAGPLLRCVHSSLLPRRSIWERSYASSTASRVADPHGQVIQNRYETLRNPESTFSPCRESWNPQRDSPSSAIQTPPCWSRIPPHLSGLQYPQAAEAQRGKLRCSPVPCARQGNAPPPQRPGARFYRALQEPPV